MSLPVEVQVLIVGAGPTGLASAITLANLGVQVYIVDSSSSNPDGSRASVIHIHTMEALDPFDLASPLIEAGIPAPTQRFLGSTNVLADIDFTKLRNETKFPHALLITQDKVESLFLEKVEREGIPLIRNKAVIKLRPTEDYPGIEVSFADGTITRTQYVIGADGARSTVRRLNGIEFKDPQTGHIYDNAKPEFHMVLADVYLQEPIPSAIARDRVSLHLDNFFVLIPVRSYKTEADGEDKSTSFWRLAYATPVGEVDSPHDSSLEFFQAQLDRLNHWDTRITISSLVSSSRYRVRHAVAATYFKKMGQGSILLAGDAAHVHSPAGGQGVNLGICDGIAAAKAVHAHIQTKGEDSVLQNYADWRRAVGINTIERTRKIANLVKANKGWRKLVRNLVLRSLGNIPPVNRRLARSLSGIINRPQAGHY